MTSLPPKQKQIFRESLVEFVEDYYECVDTPRDLWALIKCIATDIERELFLEETRERLSRNMKAKKELKA